MDMYTASRLKKNETGYALILALVVLVILGLLLGTLGIRMVFWKKVEQRFLRSRLAAMNVQNAIRHLKRTELASHEVQLDSQQSYQSVVEPFGFLWRADASGTCGEQRKHQTVLAGADIAINPDLRLDMPPSPYPLKRGRNLSIEGIISLPPGMSTKGEAATLPVAHRDGKSPLYSQLNYAAFLGTCNRCLSFQSVTDSLPIGEGAIHLNGQQYQWNDNLELNGRETDKLVGPGILQVQGTLKVTGNMTLVGFAVLRAHRIIVEGSVQLDGVILAADEIQINGATGHAQIIGGRTVWINNARLSSGTVVVVRGREQEDRFTGTLHVGSSTIVGTALMPLPPERHNPFFRSVFEDVNWQGLIVLDGETEVRNLTVSGYLRPGILREPGAYVPRYNRLDSLRLQSLEMPYLIPNCFGSARMGVFRRVL